MSYNGNAAEKKYLKFLRTYITQIDKQTSFVKERKWAIKSSSLEISSKFPRQSLKGIQEPHKTDDFHRAKPEIDSDRMRTVVKEFRKLGTLQKIARQMQLGIPLDGLKETAETYFKDSQTEIDTSSENSDALDWDFIAKANFPQHSAQECSSHWENQSGPNLNTGTWTPQESKKLMGLVGKYGTRSWEDISKRIQGRSPLMCFREYTQLKRKHKTPLTWSAEDDEKLQNLCLIYGEKDWGQISLHFKDRHPAKCMHRWIQSANPAVSRHGYWNEEEELRTILAKQSLQNNQGEVYWESISKYVPGRTGLKIREHFKATIDKGRRCSQLWSRAQDKQLRKQVQKFGIGNWVQIAKIFEGRRIARDCRCRANQLGIKQDELESSMEYETSSEGLSPKRPQGQKRTRSNQSNDDWEPMTMVKAEEEPPRPRKRRARKVSKRMQVSMQQVSLNVLEVQPARQRKQKKKKRIVSKPVAKVEPVREIAGDYREMQSAKVELVYEPNAHQDQPELAVEPVHEPNANQDQSELALAKTEPFSKLSINQPPSEIVNVKLENISETNPPKRPRRKKRKPARFREGDFVLLKIEDL